MSAAKKSSLFLLCLSLAVAGLLGVFAIIDASSANASQGKIHPITSNTTLTIGITPTQLQATLPPNEQVIQTLWITNTGGSPITFTIHEMTNYERQAEFKLEPTVLPVIDPELKDQGSAQGRALAIIFLRESPDLTPAYQMIDKDLRAQYVYNRLLETASHSQELFNWLESEGTEPHRFLAANAIAATLDNAQLTSLAINPLVRQISPIHQRYVLAAEPTPLLLPQQPADPSLQPDTVEWNIAKIRADEAWSAFGVRGDGAVVGIVDTGVQYDHPALVNSYRGNLGDNSFDHNYSWFDFVNGYLEPYDDNGHGSMGAGIVSGDDGGTNQIGVAPGADWIAVKACSGGGSCDDADLLDALDWMIAPTDVSGNNADPAKKPDIVLGMWGGGSCDTYFLPSIQALRAAGIMPVFGIGGGGPNCYTVGSPGDLPEVLASGSTDQNDLVASFSPRGPSCWGGIKPDVVSPGVNIRTSNNNSGYWTLSGNSPATAHLAGALAMILSANPTLSMEEATEILFSTALCIYSNQCGGDPCPGANNVYGHGRIDVYEAVNAALSNLPSTELPWLSEVPISGTLQAGENAAVIVAFDSSGLDPGIYTGMLGIQSGDLGEDFTFVPVTMDVTYQEQPNMVIDPLSFSATLPISGMQTDTLTISNDGDDILIFSLDEISSTQRLAPSPVDGTTFLPNLFSTGEPSHSSVVEEAVRMQLIFMGQSRLIVYLRGHADLLAAYNIMDRTARVQYVYDQLRGTAAQSDDLYNWLLSQGAQPRRLLATNAIAATLDSAQLEVVLGFPQVARVGINGHAEILQDETANENWLVSQSSLPDAAEWNIAKIRADETWSTFGITGQGAVVGIIDTGVMYTHPALITQYRGNQGGGNFDHNYNWYDLINGEFAPYDDNNHGTFGIGITVGDGGEDNQIGVAPGAKWVAVKGIDQYGGTSFEILQAAFDWMLAPTDLNGNGANPAMAPQVVLNLWSIVGCNHTFDNMLVVMRAANILPIFAPGGGGPECSTMGSPAADPNAFSAGATDSDDVIGPFSERGPSCYDGSIKPDVTAPGVNVRSSIANGSYQIWSGTSVSTAHLAGAAALLFSANQNFILNDLEQTLFDTAVCREPFICGGGPCPNPNNTYGYGRIDVFEAVSATLGTIDIPWLIAGPLEAELQPGEIFTTSVIFNAGEMLPGPYHAGIAIDSNDPDSPHVTLPVTLTVTAACEPIADLSVSYTPDKPVVGGVITFTASATGSLPINFTWDFGDGFYALGSPVTHAYTNPGMQVVKLAADNGCGEPVAVEVDLLVRQRFWLPLVR
jgi:subtilisin family serine protease